VPARSYGRERGARYAPEAAAPSRVHVASASAAPRTLNDIANDPIPSKPGARPFGIPAAWAPRLVIYPVLLLGLGVALYVSWGQLFPKRADASGGRGGDQRGTLQGGADGNQQNPGAPKLSGIGPAEGSGEKGSGENPKNPAQGNKNDDANKAKEGAKPDGAAKPGAGAQDPAALTNKNAAGANANNPADAKAPPAQPYVIRAISYRDDADGLERAKSTAAELKNRGFADARVARLPKTKGSTDFECVILVGLGDTARDPYLALGIDRLTKLPGFGSGQANQRPFANAFPIRQPEADPARTTR
jgi:hypothetical protein